MTTSQNAMAVTSTPAMNFVSVPFLISTKVPV